MHKHDPRPPKTTSDLDHQAVDDPLDSTTMPHATRSSAPDKARVKPRLHGRTHAPIVGDRHSGKPDHGRAHLPAREKKGGSRSWVGPERAGEREAIDELGALEAQDEADEGGGGGGQARGTGGEEEEAGAADKALTLDEYEARLGHPV